MKRLLLAGLICVIMLGSDARADGHDLLRRARSGDVNAMRTLGKRLFYGQGVPQQRHNAIKWWEKAAQEGDARSMLYLAQVYEVGRGAHKDLRKAYRYYREAAEAGAEEPAERGIKRLPLHISADWWKERAEAGDTAAMLKLANAYYDEHTDIISERQAAQYYTQAARKGNKKAIAQMKHIPLRYSLEYWEEKRSDGDEDAARYIAECYAQGTNTDINERKADEAYAQLMEIYARRSNTDLLGALNIVPWKYAESYLTQSAHSGNTNAMLILAKEYENGNHTDPDPERAEQYYAMAAKHNDAEAMAWLDKHQSTAGKKRTPFPAASSEPAAELSEEAVLRTLHALGIDPKEAICVAYDSHKNSFTTQALYQDGELRAHHISVHLHRKLTRYRFVVTPEQGLYESDMPGAAADHSFIIRVAPNQESLINKNTELHRALLVCDGSCTYSGTGDFAHRPCTAQQYAVICFETTSNP